MKKVSSILLVLVAFLFLAGCKKDEEKPSVDEITFDEALSAEYEGLLADKKVYLTTAGQADLQIVHNIITSAGLSEEAFTSEALLEAKNVETGSVVILVIGASGKGLGEAGTDVAKETARAEAFGAKQTAGEIILVVVHVGGEGRTGTQSDPIILKAVPAAKLSMVVDTKTKNNLFVNAVGTSEADLHFYTRATALVNPFKVLFDL